MAPDAYKNVNRRWASACKSVLGSEIGELSDYSDWLCEEKRPILVAKSKASGREITSSYPYPAKAPILLDFSEVDFFRKFPPLKKERLGGIDGIVGALEGRVALCGNIVLGNSMNVERSTDIVDCLDVYGSEQVAYCKGIGHSCEGTYSESLFGCNGFGYCSFMVRGFGIYKSSRCLEVSRAYSSSDCYFSHGLSNCRDCIFCFNLKNASNCVGNVKLGKEEYAEVKARLLAEARKTLIKEKRLPSLIEIAGNAPPDRKFLAEAIGKAGADPKEGAAGKQRMEALFQNTASLVLGKKCGTLEGMEGWLLRNCAKLQQGESCASGKPLSIPDYSVYSKFPRGRLLALEESEALGEKAAISREEALCLSLSGAGKAIGKIAYFSPEWKVGKEQNVIESPLNIDSTDCYRCILAIESKGCGYCYIPRNAEAVFGTYFSRQCSFIINCSKSVKLRRCLECDSCRDCSDCYFCHNCENVHESMFCFNAKNLRYAIGNAEMPKEEYVEVKARVLSELNAQLEKRGKAGESIFSVLSKAR